MNREGDDVFVELFGVRVVFEADGDGADLNLILLEILSFIDFFGLVIGGSVVFSEKPLLRIASFWTTGCVVFLNLSLILQRSGVGRCFI